MKGRGSSTDRFMGFYGDVLEVSREEQPVGTKEEEEMMS